MKASDINQVAVIGAGAWGTTLADLLARKGLEVTIWAFEPEVVQGINRDHVNAMFLPDAPLAPALQASGDIADAVRQVEVVVCAVPSHVVRGVMTAAATAVSGTAPLVVCVSKGLEPEAQERLSCVLARVFGHATPVAVLSGPSFAREVYERQPTAVVAAAGDHDVAQRVQALFSTGSFRVYSHTDVVGVELGGALKNVIAIAAGLSDGLGYGTNTKAALVTRGLAEITRLGVAMGANPLTFLGLAGVGDLVTTCTSPLSRNRRVGEAIARGERLEDVLTRLVEVAEMTRVLVVIQDVLLVKAVVPLSRGGGRFFPGGRAFHILKILAAALTAWTRRCSIIL